MASQEELEAELIQVRADLEATRAQLAALTEKTPPPNRVVYEDAKYEMPAAPPAARQASKPETGAPAFRRAHGVPEAPKEDERRPDWARGRE